MRSGLIIVRFSFDSFWNGFLKIQLNLYYINEAINETSILPKKDFFLSAKIYLSCSIAIKCRKSQQLSHQNMGKCAV
jgi:hypothetical protein